MLRGLSRIVQVEFTTNSLKNIQCHESCKLSFISLLLERDILTIRDKSKSFCLKYLCRKDYSINRNVIINIIVYIIDEDLMNSWHSVQILQNNGTKMASFLSNHKSYPYIILNPQIENYRIEITSCFSHATYIKMVIPVK